MEQRLNEPIIERKGAKTILITTYGFRGVVAERRKRTDIRLDWEPNFLPLKKGHPYRSRENRLSRASSSSNEEDSERCENRQSTGVKHRHRFINLSILPMKSSEKIGRGFRCPDLHFL
jgi:hypothetical protein